MYYYATFKGIGLSDIAVFKSKKDRDNWVNFQDPYSKALGSNSTNCTFDRMAISSSEAEKRIKTMRHTEDLFNADIAWYVLN